MFIIQDWASNTLQYTGKFNFGCYGNDLGVPLKFKTFDDACEYIDTHYNEEESQDLFVIKLGDAKP